MKSRGVFHHQVVVDDAGMRADNHAMHGDPGAQKTLHRSCCLKPSRVVLGRRVHLLSALASALCFSACSGDGANTVADDSQVPGPGFGPATAASASIQGPQVDGVGDGAVPSMEPVAGSPMSATSTMAAPGATPSVATESPAVATTPEIQSAFPSPEEDVTVGALPPPETGAPDDSADAMTQLDEAGADTLDDGNMGDPLDGSEPIGVGNGDPSDEGGDPSNEENTADGVLVDGQDTTDTGEVVDDGVPPTDDASSEFNIELVFQSDEELDPIVEEAFMGAKQRWERVIVGDLEDVESRFPAQCDTFQVPDTVDDLVIGVSLQQIDGPNGILGAAGPCLLRGDGAPLPYAGVMQFDVADLLRFGEQGRLEEIVLHEMGHVLGVGALWEPLGLLEDPAGGQGGDADTAFTGSLAVAEFDAIGGDGYDGAKVPVQNSGGQGVANGHWRESVFGNELMTPFLSPIPGLMSEITIASLEDLGYEVNYAEADAYSWPPDDNAFGGGALGAASVSTDFAVWLEDDILDIPIYAVDRNGVVTRIR